MKTAKKRVSTKRRPRALLNQLVGVASPAVEVSSRALGCEPFTILSGYGMFGGPIWRSWLCFEQWLMQRFYYPPDTGKWDRFIQLNSADNYESYQMFLKLIPNLLVKFQTKWSSPPQVTTSTQRN